MNEQEKIRLASLAAQHKEGNMRVERTGSYEAMIMQELAPAHHSLAQVRAVISGVRAKIKDDQTGIREKMDKWTADLNRIEQEMKNL